MYKGRVVWFLFYLAMLLGVYYIWYVVDSAMVEKDTTDIKKTDSRLTDVIDDQPWERRARKEEYLLDLRIAEAERHIQRSHEKDGKAAKS